MQSLYLDCTNRVNSFQTGKLMVSSMNMLNHGDTFYSYENKAIILQKKSNVVHIADYIGYQMQHSCK